MSFFIIFICIVGLVLLITWGKINAFLAFLAISITAALLLGMPLTKIVGSVQKGLGDTLGSLAIIVCIGVMMGKLVAESGAARKITDTLMKAFGTKYIQWALMVTGFIAGIPLFYNVGFVLMVPLIFSVVYQYKLPALYIGLPMLAALSVTHGFLPPHPAPTALVAQFHANLGLTLLYGIALAIPAIIIAGPLFARTLKHIKSEPLQIFQAKPLLPGQMPGSANSFLTSLLPVLLLIFSTLLTLVVSKENTLFPLIAFLGDPVIVMILSLAIATYTLGLSLGKSIQSIMTIYAEGVKDISMILLIIGGAGSLKQVFADSGINNEIGAQLMGLNIHPLVLGWLISCIIRVCIGSATIAGLTTAGIIAPLMAQTQVNPNLMVLSIGAGSLMFSHVNDPSFWLFKEYFNLSLKDTVRSWSMMESLVAVVGLIGVMILNAILA